ncbi:hypothetical protein DUI87_02852 [Hirundo rustica rustica]|uniref:RNA-directed DNA polymerase n=1 Tax=Hirundo rustica rustica TaxID=333673 RepID=A0A3M0LA50_HIRRU|nr:hypothetical protein DUI87_02852 [Hirundo rustica rustica]
MFKGKVPSTHHATDATWSKWIALITQRAHIGNPNRPGILEIITNWPEGDNFGLTDEEEQEQVTRAEDGPPYNQLPAEETRYALYIDGSCRIVGMKRKWKAAVWSPTRQVAQATEGEGRYASAEVTHEKTHWGTQAIVDQFGIKYMCIGIHNLATIGCFRTARGAGTGSEVRFYYKVKLSKEGRNSPKRLTKEMFEHLLQSNASLQLSLDSYRGQISVHAPSHKLLNEEFHLIPREKRSRRPLKALTVFTDASGASHKSVMTWRNPQTQRWEADVEFVEGSPQVAELAAVVRAFEKFLEPINLVTDSAYVAGVVSRAEQAVLKETDNEHLFRLLSKLIYLISHQEHPFYVMHVRSHTDLPSEIAEGNRQADSLAAPVKNARLPDIFQQAKLSHQQYHQNVPGLIHQFQLPRSQARAIVATCPNCQVQAMPSMVMGVNPRGLGSCEVWQTDITHIPSFGHLKYVHVSIDTHSGTVYASAHAGEKTEHAKKHLVQAFSVLGIPKEINTDNGPAYTSKGFLEFVQQWGVEHKTGIPHSPTGQAVVEQAHQMLKQVLARQSSTTVWMSPHEKLCKAMFTINFLNCSFENMSPPVVHHFNSGNQFKLSQRPLVMIRDPETWENKGPYELVTWGRGYACVATPSGPRWIPQK